MSRGRKLLIAGIVLAVGFGLAWPFRKTTADKTFESIAAAPTVGVNRHANVGNQRPTAQPHIMARALGQSLGQPRQLPSPEPNVAAKTTSMGDFGVSGTSARPTASFDLAHHPALARFPRPKTYSPVTPPFPPNQQAPVEGYLPAQLEKQLATARPAYATADRDRMYPADERRPIEVRHVVQNSDTLEKLAKRYLGEEGRALEIFDLNRDVLENPRLLPIGAQLRIPAQGDFDARTAVD